jgi:hypothetical protein
MRIRNTATAVIAAAGLSVAGLGAFAAGPASAATTSVRHRIKHPIKAVAICSGKGQFGWSAVGKRYLCRKPAGWRHYRWVRDPIPQPVPPVPPAPGLTAAQLLQLIQAWAVVSGNADWSQVFLTDTANLAAAEALTPTILTGPLGAVVSIKVTPSGGVQATIAAAAQALVTDAQAALAAPPPGNFTASWDAIMTDQVAYGTLVAANPGDWGAYTYSQPDANAAFSAAGSDDLTAIEAVGITVPPIVTIVVPTAAQILDNAVIGWAESTPGGAANTSFGYLGEDYYPMGNFSFSAGTGVTTLAQSALTDPPPGNLAAPFTAVANAYVAIGIAIAASQSVTSPVATLNNVVTVWNAALAADGTNVSSWFVVNPF